MTALAEKIRERTARIVVVGMGYVGLPLIAEFARAGFRVTGLDHDPEKVRRMNGGESYIGDVPSDDLAPHVKTERLSATTDDAALKHADVVVVCVQTPLNKTKDPDMRFIVEAADQIAKHQHDDMLIVLESTSYPGTTNEVLLPRLTRGNRTVGEQVFIAFSPERTDPGNRVFRTRTTPKVLAGATPRCLGMATNLYSQIIDTLVPVSSTQTAEMVKLLENTFRAVNIGLVNEIAIMSRKLGIDPFEVIRAAATKPFGFMPFFPGPGLGGHCIPIDPLYLSWKLRTLQYDARFIELADSINSGMPAYVVQRASEALNEQGKPLRGSSILIYGVAYKRDVNDTRESPALPIMRGLEKRGSSVAYMDPHVATLDDGGSKLDSVDIDTDFGVFDAVVIVTDHTQLERERLLLQAKLIVDTRDALRQVVGDRTKVYGL
jgi:UDP-N-acetyl-D-glucosamine dehydrogenase